MVTFFPGRSYNDVKNRGYQLKKRHAPISDSVQDDLEASTSGAADLIPNHGPNATRSIPGPTS